MANANISLDGAILRISVDTLIAEHGKWRVVAAAIKAMIRRRKGLAMVRSIDLPPRTRLDIGLPTVVDPPRRPAELISRL